MTSDLETAIRNLAEAIRAELTQVSVQSEPDRLLSIPEAAQSLGIGRSMLYGEINRGAIRTVKVGRRRLVPGTAVREYIGQG